MKSKGEKRIDVGGGSSSRSKSPLDRSKVRILLCDNDEKSSQEIFELLCECSYQVTAVRTPRQVIGALNAEGRDIDIILAEVDLPVAKGLKMLKYIMRDIELRRIPIIMMSAQDEVSFVVKCLKLGAADYLVKPLRTNELMNLWTHMWRRRRMLGLAEKNILNPDFDMVASDLSDANTNSTALFSDDTDDKSRRSSVPKKSISNYPEDESNIAAAAKPLINSSAEYPPNTLRPSEQTAQISSCPKKSELKIGESSAFFTYVKSSNLPSTNQRVAKSDRLGIQEKRETSCQPAGVDVQRDITRETTENYYYSGNGFPSSDSGDRSGTPTPPEVPLVKESREQISTVLMHPRNEAQVNVSGHLTLTPFPYYMPGLLNQVMMPPSAQLYHGNQPDFPKHATSSNLQQYNSLLQCPPRMPMMSTFPYYPFQMPTSHLWQSVASPSSTKINPSRVERREAALVKFRQKKKDRCFAKKIRYINRKRLAERRPRVRGQFVRQINGVNVDLNRQQVDVEDFDDDEEEEEEDYSLEGNGSRY